VFDNGDVSLHEVNQNWVNLLLTDLDIALNFMDIASA
jgi:hypothetical protein